MKKFLSAVAALAFLAWSVSPALATVNAQTGTTYTFVNTDCDPNGRTLVTFNNSSSVAVTLPQAGASGNFVGGCVIHVLNIGAGTVTITPTTSTINGGSTKTYAQNASGTIWNDSTSAATGNYWATN
jgi:hypothetical protein